MCVLGARAEVNIKPWEILLGELKKGNERIPWLNREPYAYWKGNPSVAETREDLMKCNVSQNQEWNARLYAQVLLSFFLAFFITLVEIKITIIPSLFERICFYL